MIRINQLEFSYKNKLVFKDTTFTIPENAISILIGPNGSGKSTLIRLLIGNLIPNKGNIIFELLNNPMSKKDYGVLYSQLRYYPHLTVKKNIQLRKIELGSLAIDQNEFDEILHDMNLTEYLSIKASSLSKGNQMKLSLALVLMQNPVYLFLDEPTSNLDMKTIEDLAKLLNKQNDMHKTTILIASHDQNFISLLNGKTIELKK